MAVLDDLRRLASEDVVYLSWTLVLTPGGIGPTVIWYRGRLRQSTDGVWVFHTYANANGVFGITLGPAFDFLPWSSFEMPGSGITVTKSNWLGGVQGVAPGEVVTISQTPSFGLEN